MKKVLWLTSWYPNRLDKFDGDFIQRHARAVANYCKVHVIYVKKDNKLNADKIKIEVNVIGNLTEQVIYYNAAVTGIKLLDKYLSHRMYKMKFRTATNKYFRENGKPDLVHVHVAMKAGIEAIRLKKELNIPFIISEHWTAYLDNADVRIAHYPFVFNKILKKVLQQASAFTTVSNHLGKAVQKHFPFIQYKVIPNVVDTDTFFPVQKRLGDTTRFIHVSSMNYQKNTEAILEALFVLKDTFAFEMNLYGPVSPALESLITELGLQGQVFVKGEVTHNVLSKDIQQSDALILYSRFETFGCVLIEANACGIPVIVSDLPVFHEIIKEGFNGVFAEGENPAALAEKLRQFILEKNTFDKNGIAESAAEKYNFKKIGRQFFDLYQTLTT